MVRGLFLIRNLNKLNQHALPLVLVLFVFIYLTVYILPMNIHGDGQMHTTYARFISETGSTPQYSPYVITSVGEDSITMQPITYPLTSQVEMSLFFTIGDEDLLEFFSPVLGTLIALFLFLILRKVNKYFAFFASIFAVILNAHRFMMVPLMEQFLLFGMVASIYYYYLLIIKHEKKYIALTGLFLGLVISTKEQGLVFFVVIILHGFFTGIYKRIKMGDSTLFKYLSLMVLIALVVSICPLMDQIARNGTLVEMDGKSWIPFLKVNYTLDQESLNELANIVGYKVTYNSIFETVKVYMLQPLYYAQSWRAVQGNDISQWVYLIAILLIMGFYYLFKKKRTLSLLLILLFFMEVGVTFYTNTHPYQYHNLGLTILGVFIVAGLFGAGKYIRSFSGKTMSHLIIYTFLVVFIVTFACGYMNYAHEPLWGNSGRNDDNYIEAYQEMGNFVRSSTSDDAIVLTGGGSGQLFAYYADRKTMWISPWGGSKVPLIFSTSDEEEALHWLQQYSVSYIFIDKRQLSYPGVSDRILSHGLMDYIDESNHFEKVHVTFPDNELLILYEVIW